MENIIDRNPTYSLLNILSEGRESDYYSKDDIYYDLKKQRINFFPINIRIKIIQTFISLLITFGFINYLMFVIFKNNNEIEKTMFERINKYHFIHLFLTSIVFSLMDNIVKINDISNALMNKIVVILIFIFNFLAFVSLIYIYLKTKIKNNHLMLLVIKKGVYSSLIILLFHNFFNCIIAFIYINFIRNEETILKDLYDTFLISGKIILPLYGIIVIIFSIYFKDIIAMFINFLIFIGLTVEQYKNITKYPELFIIDACFMSFSFFGLFSFSLKCLDKKLLWE